MTTSMGQRRAPAGRTEADDGFTLIEAVIATSLAAVMLLSVAYTAFAGLNAVMTTKRNQQATALGTLAIEVAREFDWDKLAMVTADLAGDPAILTTCTGLVGTRFYDPDGAGPIGCEQVVHAAAGGAIPTHVTTETVDGVSYTVRRYVTCTAAMAAGDFTVCPGTKRMVATVSWVDRGRSRSLRSTTLVTRARRGLPVPKFTLTPSSQTKTASQGVTVSLPFVVRNLGVADSYQAQAAVNTVVPPTPPRVWPVEYRADVDDDGLYDPVVDTVAHQDSDGDGWVEIPQVQTTAQRRFFLVFVIPGTDPSGSADVQLSVRSAIDNGVTKDAVATVFVGTSVRQYFLHNRPARVGSPPPSADTSLDRDYEMDLTAPTAASLVRYSTNAPNSAGCANDLGRCIRPSSATDQTNPGNNANAQVDVANWVRQVPTALTFNGTGVAQLFVARPAGACTGPVTVTAYLRNKPNSSAVTAGDGVVLLATGTTTLGSLGSVLPCAPVALNVSFNLSNVSIAANRFLELKVVLSASSAGSTMLAYDTTAFPSSLNLPLVGA